MTPEEFAKLAAEGYNRIPVVEEVLADLDTPLSTYLKLAGGPYSYLLESAHGGEKWGRYSIIGLPARTVLKVSGNSITIATDGKVVEQTHSDDPLDFIEDLHGPLSGSARHRDYHASTEDWSAISAMTPCATSKNVSPTAPHPTRWEPRTSC